MARKPEDQTDPDQIDKPHPADPETPADEDGVAEPDQSEEPATEPASEDTSAEDRSEEAFPGESAEEATAEADTDPYIEGLLGEDHDEHEHHDGLEEHGSFPTWLKVVLILLIGAGLALWGGPRLAPHLPSGLAPVADFLEPGAVRQAQEIEARLNALEQAPAPAAAPSRSAINAAVDEALTKYDATIRDDITRLRDTVSAVDGSDIESRLSQVETSVKGLEAQTASLGDRLTSAVTAGIEQQSAQTAEQAAATAANIERLKAQIDQLSSRLGTLQQKIDEVAAANTRIQEEAKSIVGASQAEKAVTEIATALEVGTSFRPALDVLSASVETDMPALSGFADRGAPSLPQLRDAFSPLAHAALRAAMRADAEGYAGKTLAFLKSQVATRSLTPQEGNSTDAVLSRMDAALAKNDLAAVLTEADLLTPAARGALAGWLDSISKLAAAKAELDAASAQIARRKS